MFLRIELLFSLYQQYTYLITKRMDIMILQMKNLPLAEFESETFWTLIRGFSELQNYISRPTISNFQ